MAETLTKRRSRRAKTRDLQERELRRLLLSVSDDVGFRLYLATYDQPKRRDELIARVIEEAAAEKVKVTRLDVGDAGPETNLVGLLRAHLQSIDLPPGWRKAMMVTGIEQRLDYSSGPEGYAFLHHANLLRDALPEAAPVPVVLWLSRMASAALPAEAPDLWHWRAANFDFTGDEAPRLQLLRELTTISSEDRHALSGEQRQVRIRMLEELIAELEREGPPKSMRQEAARAYLLLDLAIEELREREAAQALPRFERALHMFREIRERKGEAMALSGLARSYSALGDLRRTIDLDEQRLAIAREIEDRRGEGEALGAMASAWAELGEYRRAAELNEQQLAIAREIGDGRLEADALGHLGYALAKLGDVRRAIELFNQQLAIARDAGDRREEGRVLGSLGKAWGELGESHREIAYQEQALTIAREVGDRRREAGALLGLGAAYADLGEVSRTLELVEQALAIAREVGARDDEGDLLFTLALARDWLGERNEAVRQMRGALAILEAIDAKDMVEKARAQLAEWTGEEG